MCEEKYRIEGECLEEIDCKRFYLKGIGCLNHITHPCEECGRVAGRYTGTDIGKLETEMHYLERILAALKKNMAIQVPRFNRIIVKERGIIQ